MNAHTPGPWRYMRHSVDSNYMKIYCSSDPGEGDNLRGYCGEANARLIAASPDLLEALQAMQQALMIGTQQSFNDAVSQGFKAIAKATGVAE